jgi:hypothetical protein
VLKTRSRSRTIEEVIRPRTALGHQLAIAFNFKIELTNVIFVASRTFAFSTQPGSFPDFDRRKREVRFACDTVAKVFWGDKRNFFRAADAFCERRRERPHRFIQNRPGTSVVALKSDTAAEKSKDHFREIFRVARFSTFATVSPINGHRQLGAARPKVPLPDTSAGAPEDP